MSTPGGASPILWNIYLVNSTEGMISYGSPKVPHARRGSKSLRKRGMVFATGNNTGLYSVLSYLAQTVSDIVFVHTLKHQKTTINGMIAICMDGTSSVGKAQRQANGGEVTAHVGILVPKARLLLGAHCL